MALPRVERFWVLQTMRKVFSPARGGKGCFRCCFIAGLAPFAFHKIER
jgi:hypothetical protein